MKRNYRAPRAGASLAAGLIVLAALAAGTSAASASAAPAAHQGRGLAVTTTDGALRGTTAGPVDEFLGIPYAAPPVGPLRWRPPQPAAPWTGVRAATAFAPHCPQPPSGFGVASTSENCLYLNVYTPAGATASARSLPVMVWIHGGAFIAGESNDYNPAGLVRHGVIVVTINYRLGALGFLAHPALASGPDGSSGNYGLMDQQAALRWVQANIRQFGGNPRNVTLSGESSGGLSVLSQLISPGARGLFSRAIVESGTYDLTQVTLATAETAGEAFAAKVGCTSQTAACLRALPVSAIVDNEDFAGYRPDIDGTVLTQSIGPALASGHFNRVPVINGTNRDEWRLFVAQAQLDGAPPVTAANYEASIASLLGVPATAAAAIAAQYPLSAYSSPPVALGAVGTDAIFACPALTVDESLSKYVPTYAYEFNDQNAPERYLAPVGFPYGAAHESEVQYLFSLQNTPFPGALTPRQQQLAAAMKQYWTDLARTGSPASWTEPRWPRFDSASQQILSLIPPQPGVETGFATEHHCAFWGQAS
ncbi:MAG TPA: carboxylesterase/lipase family protein [Streptosporangiaceae bacterium]|nr:carboxylesterase/lipase family protein [Streptosporangiaceae bacterium]